MFDKSTEVIEYMYTETNFHELMARPKKQLPTLRQHKPSGHAIVVWDGVTYYLGNFGSVESVNKYQGICSNITLFGIPIVDAKTKLSVRKMAEEFLSNLPKNFPVSSLEPIPIRRSVLQMVSLQGDLDAETYSPAKFHQLRQHWIDRGLSVSTINKYHNYILMMFRWAAMMDYLSSSVWHNLTTVGKLKPMRSPARDPKKVEPVELSDVEAIRMHVSPMVWEIIQIQLVTGMRAGEVLSMTNGQIKDGVYRPENHKNKWRGHRREVHLGPIARKIIARLSEGLGPDDRIFHGYTSSSLWRHIDRACKKVGVPHWHPHQLRHRAGTEVREKMGLDAAQAFLGHATAKTSEIYAKLKDDLRKKASEEVG